MSPVVREYMSDFAQRYVAEGLARGKIEGHVEGRVAILLRLLTLRFGPLTEAIQARLRSARSEQLDAVVDCLLTAKTLDEALRTL